LVEFAVVLSQLFLQEVLLLEQNAPASWLAAHRITLEVANIP
jgi:hypothetical protein